MIKVKDGYAKLIGTTYQGSSTNVLLSNGGNFPIHSSRNNEANKLVRTDSNGFLQTGWINTTSGDMGTGTITKIYCSNDDYIRYKTPANFFSSLTNSGNNISITVAGQNRTLQVGYASNSKYTGITWTSNTKVGSYSKLCRISYYANVLLSVNLSQNNQASNHLFLISTGYGSANIIQLGANNYSGNSSVKMRVTSADATHFDVEILNSFGYNNAEYLSVGCKAIKCDNECSITTYTSYTAGSGTVEKEITSSYNSIVTNLTGNATTASQLQTPRTLWGRSFNGTANVTGSLSSVGDINMSGVMKSSKETSTYIAGNQGNALINSTAPAGRYVMLFRGVSTSGYFTHGVYQKSYLLQYTAKPTVDAGTNSVTKSATLLDESGNSAFPGYVTSTGFKKSGSSDSYVLLGGGGHKTIDSFQTGYDGRYVKKSGDTMTGTLTTRSRVYAQLSGRTDKVGLFHSSTSNKGGIILADTNGTEHTLYLTTSNLQWKGRTVWDSGNDGSGSGLDADMLDGTHKSGLFTALSSSSSTNLSITIGGTTKAIADLYATQAVNADKLDNLQATSFMRCDGTNSIGLSGGNGNTAGWRLALEKDCSNQGWSINNIVFSVTSRHTGQGIMSIGFHTTNKDSTTYIYQINFKGSTTSNTGSPWRAFYNTSTKKFRLFWYYDDYNSAQINVLSRSGFSVPTNGTWYETLPSDNGTELTIYYNNAQTATQLLNSRKINGTSFNGTADITTSAWGATRTISLTGAVTGSVQTNGSGNITISTTYGTGNITNLDNRYLKKTGDTMNGTLSFHPTGSSDASPKIYSTVSGDLTSLNFEVADDSSDRFVFRINYYDNTNNEDRERFIINWNGVTSKAAITAPSFKGNATSATQLQTSRKINGTSFNGTANITTSYWGSTRTLTIGNTGKSVNGSGNVSWSLSEIGAAPSSHTHGTLHSTFTTELNNTTTDSGWSMINSSYKGFLLKSIRTQLSAPNWIENNYAAGICFGGSDTKGVLSIAYGSPAIRFAGGNGTKPVWWVRLTGASGATYNLANMWTGTRYWANIAVSTSSSTSTSPTFSSCYTSNWFRSEGKTGWYSQTYGGGWYMTDSTWLRSFNNKGVVAKCFYASDWSSSTYLLRSDGGAAAFHWSGQSGQPSWVWGGNNQHQYYVYNPSNFSVNYAKSAGNADTLDGQHSTHYFRKYNRSDMGSSMNLNTLKTFGIFEVRTSEITTTNSPMSGYYPLLNFINGEHVQIQIAGTTGKLFYRATQTANIGTSAEFTHSWAAFIDNTNYTSYIKKIGTSTVGGTDRPIYLSSGTPTPISSTKGSASLPVYLKAGTITACTPSSVFSNLSNSGTKLSISVAGQNRTLTVMYATSTQYVVSSGKQTALSGTTAANSGIRLYEAYNNGYPISYGNLLSMKGRGSTELLMGWKSGANRMYYRSNSNINEGWTGWSVVATLADISNAVKTGTTGHLAYYSSTSSVSSYDSSVGNSYTPIYLSSGVPKACNGVIITQFADYDIYCSSSNAAFIKAQGNFSPVQSVTRISAGLVRIQFSVNPNQFKIILVPMSTRDTGFKQRYVTDYEGYDDGSGKVNTIVVGISDDYSRNDGSFHMYIFNFNFL